MCLFGVSSKKLPHTQYPPNSENFALRKQFFAQNTYRLNLGSSAAKIRIRIGNSPENFKFGVKNLTASSFIAVSAHAQYKIINLLKIFEIEVQFPNFLVIGNLARRVRI